MDEQLQRRAAIFAALGEPVRLALVDRLVLGDLSPGQLATELGLGTNLLAHHLKVLEDAGVIRRIRSEGDRRRSYVQLRIDDDTVRAVTRSQIVPRTSAPESRPLRLHRQLCPLPDRGRHLEQRQHDPGRLRRDASGPAGTPGGGRSRPAARARARACRPLSIQTCCAVATLVVAVCDNAHEELGPDLPRIHWSIPDPVRRGSQASFEDAYAHINDRVRHLSTIQADTPKAS